jgi:hypothetical protein
VCGPPPSPWLYCIVRLVRGACGAGLDGDAARPHFDDSDGLRFLHRRGTALGGIAPKHRALHVKVP